MSDTDLFENPLFRSEAVERRKYQASIASTCLKGNTLVCLPTGLGKSLIAALVAATRLEESHQRRVVILAPTKPLVVQHHKTLRKVLKLDPTEFAALTGQIPPEDREELWKKKVVSSTPQVFMNDIITGRVQLSDITLLVFDEAHRAVGDYAYTFIAERYADETDGLILGLTASPGSSREAIEEVCRNLRIEQIESRGITSVDVKPYIGGIKVEWVLVPLPEVFREVKGTLATFVREHLRGARDYGYLETTVLERTRLREVLSAGERIRKDLTSESAPRDVLRKLTTELYASIHAIRAIELLETQGMTALKTHLDGLGERFQKRAVPSLRLFLEDADITKASGIVAREVAAGTEHPKVEKLVKVLREALETRARRLIVFTNYRSTAARLVELLNGLDGVSAVRLVGQATKGRDRGLSQKEQTMLLEDFKSGEYNVLVATQIGEEGLDIIECDQVIFYDTVPSAIRFIQRRGRTGRKGPGKATILIAAETRDEAYYWIAQRRERVMARALREVVSGTSEEEKGQPKLEDFLKQRAAPPEGNVVIVVDSREVGAPTTRELSKFDVILTHQPLPMGDFVLSDRVVVERKTVDDFAASIIDGRLFSQLSSLKGAYDVPMVLVEGESLQPSRDVRPEAMMGAVASVLLDFGIPMVWTRSPAETALFLYSVARREQLGGRREPRVRAERKPTSIKEEQEFIVAGLPAVDTVLAKRLLKAFGSVEKVFVASDRELQQVEGIGKKISERIRRILSAPYRGEDKP